VITRFLCDSTVLQTLCTRYASQITIQNCSTLQRYDIYVCGRVGGEKQNERDACDESKRLRVVEMKGTSKRRRENGQHLLGSCLPLGWTLVPLRLRLDWHLANHCLMNCLSLSIAPPGAYVFAHAFSYPSATTYASSSGVRTPPVSRSTYLGPARECWLGEFH